MKAFSPAASASPEQARPDPARPHAPAAAAPVRRQEADEARPAASPPFDFGRIGIHAAAVPADLGARGAARPLERAARVAVHACSCGGTCPACRAAALRVQEGDDEPVLPFRDAAHATSTAAPAGHSFGALQLFPPGASDGPPAGPADVRARLRGGAPLDGETRGRMEHAFGYDFSRVRVHTGPAAASLSAGLGARAFAIGRDVAFGSGEYQPGTMMGDALLAHELAHVVQQENARAEVSPMGGVARTDAALEADADRSAAGALAALWGGMGGALRDVARNALPRLRSGLALGRCVVTGGGITPSAFNFEQVTGGGDLNDRSLPWYAACVNATISHIGTNPRMSFCQFEVGFPGIHRLGRTSTGEAASLAAEAFNSCVPRLLRSRTATCATISACVQRYMQTRIPGVRVNSPCVTKMLTPTEWPTRH